jgi:hypothetical protein
MIPLSLGHHDYNAILGMAYSCLDDISYDVHIEKDKEVNHTVAITTGWSTGHDDEDDGITMRKENASKFRFEMCD